MVLATAITESQFRDSLHKTRKNHTTGGKGVLPWSYKLVTNLYNFYVELDKETYGVDNKDFTEFEPVDIYVEWDYYKDIQELFEAYSTSFADYDIKKSISVYNEESYFEQVQDDNDVLDLTVDNFKEHVNCEVICGDVDFLMKEYQYA